MGTVGPLRWLVLNRLLSVFRKKWSTGKHAKIAYFDLHHNPFHRYLEILMHMLEDQGYTILIKPRLGFLTSWATRPLFTDLRTVRTGKKPSGTGHLIFSDNTAMKGASLLTADYFPFPLQPHNGYRVPMPMGVEFYLYRWHDLQVDRNADRHRGVVFFGNMAPQHYDRAVLHTAFNCYTRAELLDHLAQRFPDRIARPVEMTDIAVAQGKDIVLVDRDKCYIKPHKLRPALASFDFFLALSGVVMPLCHNLIEAISVGCIPILQYPHLLSPPMENGVNCLTYSTMDELDAILDGRVPSMSQSEVRELRNAVNAYYSTYLTPTAVVGAIEKCLATASPVRLNAEAGSTAILLSHVGPSEPLDITRSLDRTNAGG